MSNAPLHWVATPPTPADAGVLWHWLPLPGAGLGSWCFTLLSLPPRRLDERETIGQSWARALQDAARTQPTARHLHALAEEHLRPLQVEFLGLVMEPDAIQTFRSGEGSIFRLHDDRLQEITREPGVRTWPAETDAWLLMTTRAREGLAEDAIRDGMLSLTPRDCSETLLTLAGQSQQPLPGAGVWALRRKLPHPSLRTSPRRFLATRTGASAGTLHLGDDSIALDAEPPPAANFALPASSAPPLQSAPTPAEPAAPKGGGTLLLSPDQLDALRGSIGSSTPPAPVAPPKAAPPTDPTPDAFTEESTALLSAERLSGTQRPETSSPATETPRQPAKPSAEPAATTHQGTALLSADQLQQAYQKAGIEPPPTRAPSPQPAPTPQPAAAQGDAFARTDGTALLSADQLQKAYQEAGVEPPPTRAPSPQPAPAPQPAQKPAPREGTALLSAEAIDAAIEASRKESVAPQPRAAPSPTAQREATAFLDADAIRDAMAAPPQRQAPRESTAYMDSAALEQALQHAQTPQGLEEDEAPAPTRRSPLLLVAAALGVAVVGLAVWLFLPREADTPIAPPPDSGSDESAAAAAAPPPFVQAEGAAAPDGRHEADDMPFVAFDLRLGEENVRLLVDAHEVLAGQMTRIRRAISDMELVYRNTSQALYQYMPCDEIHLDGAAGTARTPACATPESAEAYCNAVGRRLLTPAEWSAILAHEQTRLAPGHGRSWSGIDDGPMPPRPAEVRGLVGVLDGYDEVLRADRETLSRGALPVLRAENGRAEVQVHEGLWDRVRTRQGTLQEIKRLSFRCAIDAPLEDDPAEDAEEVQEIAAAERPAARPTAAQREPAAAPSRPAAPTQPAAPTPRTEPSTAQDRPAAPSLREERAPTRPTAAARPAPVDDDGRLQLMDPVYLPRSMQDFEEQLDEPR